MLKNLLRCAAVAMALAVPAGASNAATTYDLSLTSYLPSYTTTATATVDWSASSLVTAFDVAGVTGESLTGSTSFGSIISVWLSYAGSSYSVIFDLSSPVVALFSGTVTSYSSLFLSTLTGKLLGLGTYSATEVTTPSAVPLPAALPLMAAGLGGLALLRRRKAA